MSAIEPVELLHVAADAVADALGELEDWSLVGRDHASQYAHDLVADEAALEVLGDAGVRIISEESGRSGPVDADITVVVDPVDGSTNASLGLPHWVTSFCAVDADGPLAAVVLAPASGERFEAVRGGGARLDGEPIRPRPPVEIAKAVVGVTGPARPKGWWQTRSLGAAALDLCYVACGRLDAFSASFGLAPWDYAGGVLMCREAGAVVEAVGGRDLFDLSDDARRRVVAASHPALLAALRDPAG